MAVAEAEDEEGDDEDEEVEDEDDEGDEEDRDDNSRRVSLSLGPFRCRRDPGIPCELHEKQEPEVDIPGGCLGAVLRREKKCL